MTRRSRTERVLVAGAALTSLTAGACAWRQEYGAAVICVIVSAALIEMAAREGIAHREAQARAERLARPNPPQHPNPPTLVACCASWAAAPGQGHDRTCTHSRATRDGIVLGWNDLDRACCLRAWESHGTTHDTTTCTRTDAA
ncbi:hypothetical protein [Streptomyces altiplanensis]